MNRVDIASIGASYRSEADRAFTKALAFAVILIMAHLLEIEPSEMDAFGLKISLRDPALLYGTIAMIFGYYISRALWFGEHSFSLLPVNVAPHRIRANLRTSKKLWKAEKKNRNQSIDHKRIKRNARRSMIATDILAAPYFIVAALFVMVAIPTALYDLYRLGVFVVTRQLSD